MLDVRRLDKQTSRPIIEKYHYSGNVPAGKNIYFGWFLGTLLYAVAIYGIGANNNQAGYLARTQALPVTNANLLELKRLARIEPKIKDAPLTKFLSINHHLLRRDGYKYVISFSDPEFNPQGGIYAAANFKQIGYSSPETDILNCEGKKIGRRTLLHWRKAHGSPTIDEACKLLGYTKVKTPGKKRWFLCL
jgi:hypothetical protein